MTMRDLAVCRPSLYFIVNGKSELPESSVLSSGSASQSVPIVWGFYVLQMDGRTILIDTGFQDAVKAQQFRVTLHDPFPELASLAIEPRLVTDIVVTHHHFDHTGNIPRFPHARVIIQREAYELYRQEWPEHPEVPSSQLRRFDTEYDLDDLLHVRCIGGHTSGCSEVTFLYRGRRYLFPGDECYLLANFTRRTPIGFSDHPEVNRQYIKALAQDAIVLPFHDPEILKKYTAFGDYIARVLPEA